MMTEVVAALIWDRNKFMICQRSAHKAKRLLWGLLATCLWMSSTTISILRFFDAFYTTIKS